MILPKNFNYQARAKNGDKEVGTIEAVDKQTALSRLKNRGLIPLEVKEKNNFNFSFKGIIDKLNSIELTAESVGLKDKYLFCRQLSSMLHSGIPIVEGLNSLAQQIENKTLREVTEDLAVEIEKGKSLSDGLKQHPEVFSNYFIKLVEVGETGGFLDQTLTNLGEYFKKQNQQKKQVISAISYPVITMLASITVLILLMVTVLPKFMETFQKLNVELPLPTKIVLGISSFMTSYWWAVLSAVVGSIVGIYYYYQTESGKEMIDGLMLKVPVLKSFILENSLIVFAKNLSLLERSGVAFLQSMEIVNRNIDNAVIRNKLETARLRIKDGINITTALERQQVFPGIALQMIQVGENTGELDEKLEDIVDFYEEEVEEKFEKMVSMLEPMMIIFLTVVIGGIVASVILPIFKMSQGMG
ncbi:type II secretion system F family protein [Halanaerobacter jeridensis]|uniref:Type IV pilus assembly protein PilC n=1 Tax=Halanaerobacter jeridensis TaxID=706427 RepID=A0A938XR76_9FIRM|nr:type II secretion system F family protein [Halanaerobacter jeridensis]MBM7555289.1 type IV pilus assembly protein PilC [Halanaerobacter jeridensis]